MIYSAFVETLGFYQIITFEDKIPKPFLFNSKYSNELFIQDDFFVVYKNHKFFYYQDIKGNFDLEELSFFIKNSLLIDDIKIIHKEHSIVNEENKKRHHFFRPIKSKLFKYYLFYLFILCLGFYFYDFGKSNNIHSLDIMKRETKQILDNRKYGYLSALTLNLYEKAKKNKIFIYSLDIKNSKVLLNLRSKRKENVYTFLDEFNNNTIENIYFDEQEKRFKTNASFKIYRR